MDGIRAQRIQAIEEGKVDGELVTQELDVQILPKFDNGSSSIKNGIKLKIIDKDESQVPARMTEC